MYVLLRRAIHLIATQGGAVYQFYQRLPQGGSPEFGVDSVFNLGTMLTYIPFYLVAPVDHGWMLTQYTVWYYVIPKRYCTTRTTSISKKLSKS